MSYLLKHRSSGLELPPWHQHDSLAHQDDENDDAVDTWQYIGRSSSPTPTPANRARSLTPHLSLAPWMRVEDDSDQQHQHDLHPTRTSVRHSRPAPYTVRPSVARSRFQHGPPADQASGSSDLAPAFYSTPQHQHWSSPPSIPSRIRRKSRQSHQSQVVHSSATPASTPGPTSSPASTPPSHNEHWKIVLGLAPLAPSFVHPPALASSLALAAQAQAYTHSHSHSWCFDLNLNLNLSCFRIRILAIQYLIHLIHLFAHLFSCFRTAFHFWVRQLVCSHGYEYHPYDLSRSRSRSRS
jgi:hypothetical protein